MLANHMHDLMSKYLRRLDHELHKFKMELEADNSGITGLIEKSIKLKLFFVKKIPWVQFYFNYLILILIFYFRKFGFRTK